MTPRIGLLQLLIPLSKRRLPKAISLATYYNLKCRILLLLVKLLNSHLDIVKGTETTKPNKNSSFIVNKIS